MAAAIQFLFGLLSFLVALFLLVRYVKWAWNVEIGRAGDPARRPWEKSAARKEEGAP